MPGEPEEISQRRPRPPKAANWPEAGQDLLAKVIPIDNILFASEMIGAVPGVDPETGHNFDDTKRYLDASGLGDADKQKIFEGNARKVFPRLNERISAK